MATVTEVKKCTPVRGHEIENGNYLGEWGGNVVAFRARGETYQGKCDVGIRTPRADCVVTVDGDTITVQILDK